MNQITGQSQTDILKKVVRIERAIPVDTIARLSQMVMESVRDIEFVTFARSLVSGLISSQYSQSVRPLADLSAVATISTFTRAFVRYTSDPIMTELVYSPVQVMKQIKTHGKFAEDCDSIAGFSCGLLMAVGINARLCLVGFSPKMPGKDPVFGHVYTEAYIPMIGAKAVDACLDDDSVEEMLSRIKVIKYFEPSVVSNGVWT